MRILFDESHGQRNWEQSGFPAHTIDGSFKKFVNKYSRELKFDSIKNKFGEELLNTKNGIIIIPHPAGFLNKKSQWELDPNSLFQKEEIEIIKQFVKNGGNLILLGHRNGDEFTKTNFNDLADEFGFEFNSDFLVNDTLNFEGDRKSIVTKDIVKNRLTKGINCLVLPFCGSINIKNDNCIPIAFSPRYSISINLKQEEQRINRGNVIVLTKYHKGRVIGVSTDQLFSNKAEKYNQLYDNFGFGFNLIDFMSEKSNEL